MEIRKNERKEELQGFKHRVYGMDGVRKQTDSISCSIKRCVIKKVVDGNGIWISYNPSTKKLQRKREKQPPNLVHNLVKSRITLGEAQGLVNQILKRELQPSGEHIGF